MCHIISAKHVTNNSFLGPKLLGHLIDAPLGPSLKSATGCAPGAPLTYFKDGEVRQRFIFYTPKNPNFRTCLPKKIPIFFSIPKKIPQCFCISKFYYLSSGKLKHANFNFGFGQKQNYKLRLCYFLFELMKNTIRKKIPVLFSRPKKIPFGQNVRPQKILRTPPSLKYVSGAPGGCAYSQEPITQRKQLLY